MKDSITSCREQTVQDWLIPTQSTTLGELATVVDWHILTQSTTLGELPTVVDWLILTQSILISDSFYNCCGLGQFTTVSIFFEKELEIS